MAPSKLALFLALNLVLLAAAHGCEPYCPPIVPTPPILPQPVPLTGGGSCSIKKLKLGVCVNMQNLLKLKIGVPANEECCPLLGGLADLDAAVCLCTAIKANILGIKLNVPIDLVLLLNQCGKKCPSDFTCPI